MNPLSILLLGPPHVILSGEPIHLGRRKALGLLAYLATTHTPIQRDSLATLLWPESDRSTARANLRRTLSILTRSLGRDHFEVDHESIRLCADADIYVDLAEFYELVAHGRQGWQGDGRVVEQASRLPQQAAAVELVRGPFLDGFSLSDSVFFDDWQMLQTENVNREVADLLARLTDGYRRLGDVDRALEFAHRWVAQDPLHGQANKLLMHLLVETNRSAAALHRYRVYERLLEDELGVPPEADVTVTFEDIRAGRLSLTLDATTHTRLEQPLPAAFDAVGQRPDNLPRQMTSFIGRREEISAVRHLLCDELGCRLVTLVGAGGVGKTRLAIAAGEALVDRFADGVYFVPLVGVENAPFVPTAIAEALCMQISAASDVTTQLRAFLCNKSLLLVLDNVEQLLADQSNRGERFVSLIHDLLIDAPDLHLLLTSREPLSIQPEWIYAVAGLSYPVGERLRSTSERSLQVYGAMELFYHRARRVQVDFNWQQEWTSMSRICRYVEGLPLAIELAAPWIETLSCEEIAAQIEADMDFLKTTLRDVEPRHRSIRRVFEQTWQMLTEEERHVLSRLSVFRSGFTRLAAEQVAGATLPLLSSLVGKTLLRRDGDGRYDSQELLRQFCAEKLAGEADAVVRARDRHCAYFTGLLAQRYEALLWRRPVETYRELSAEMDNIHVAWAWAVEQGDLAAMDRAFEVYWQLLDWRGAGEMIITVFNDAAEKVANLHGVDVAQERQRLCLLGEMLIPVGQRRAHNLGLRTKGHDLAIKGLELIRQVDPVDQRKQFWAQLRLGLISIETDTLEAEHLLEGCIAICRNSGDHHGLAIAHGELAWCFFLPQILDKARWHLRESLDLIARFGRNRWSHVSHNLQSVLQIQDGDYAAAQKVVEEMRRFSWDIDNRHAVCLALGLQAQLARINGNYNVARSLCEQALQMVERVGTPDIAPYLWVKLSALSRLEGKHEEAASFLDKSAAYVDRHRLSAVSVWAEQGRLAYAQCEYRKAEAYLRKADAGGVPWKPYDEFESISADLGNVLSAAGDVDAARYYCAALHKSWEERTLPRALQALCGMARHLARTGELARAMELAVLVQCHPVAWHEHRVLMEALLGELETRMPPDRVTVARQHASDRDVWDVVAEVLTTVPPAMD